MPTPSRRDFLLQALSHGWLIGGLGWQSPAMAGWFGRQTPKALPPGQSIHSLEGRVLVNGRSARRDQLIQAGDRVEVGPGGQLIYAVGRDAFLLRERTILETSGKELLLSGLRLVSGAVMSVFGRRQSQPLMLHTPTATVGIRGTAVYSQIHPDASYVCTCYGETRLSPVAQPAQFEDISSRHHDAPRWILGDRQTGEAILPAPVIDHSDAELLLLEALLGRTPPFAVPPQPRGGPRGAY